MPSCDAGGAGHRPHWDAMGPRKCTDCRKDGRWQWIGGGEWQDGDGGRIGARYQVWYLKGAHKE